MSDLALDRRRSLMIVLALCRRDSIPDVADAVIASEWLKDHDTDLTAKVRAEAAPDVAVLANIIHKAYTGQTSAQGVDSHTLAEFIVRELSAGSPMDGPDLSDPLVVQAIRDDATRPTRAEQAERRKRKER